MTVLKALFALLLLLALTSGAGADDGLWDGVVEAPSTTTPSGKPGQVAPTPAPSSSPTYPPDTDVATAVFDMKGRSQSEPRSHARPR